MAPKLPRKLGVRIRIFTYYWVDEDARTTDDLPVDAWLRRGG